MTWGMYMPPECIFTLTKILWAPINMLQVNSIQKSPTCHPSIAQSVPQRGPFSLGLVDVHTAMASILILAVPSLQGQWNGTYPTSDLDGGDSRRCCGPPSCPVSLPCPTSHAHSRHSGIMHFSA